MFEATFDSFSYNFATEMKYEFEMSMIDKFNFFLDIQLERTKKMNFYLTI